MENIEEYRSIIDNVISLNTLSVFSKVIILRGWRFGLRELFLLKKNKGLENLINTNKEIKK